MCTLEQFPPNPEWDRSVQTMCNFVHGHAQAEDVSAVIELFDNNPEYFEGGFWNSLLHNAPRTLRAECKPSTDT